MRHRLASRSRDAETAKLRVETPLRSPKTTLLHGSQRRAEAKDGGL
jgi:hypothetical protein